MRKDGNIKHDTEKKGMADLNPTTSTMMLNVVNRLNNPIKRL